MLSIIESSWGLFFISTVVAIIFLLLFFYWFELMGIVCFICVASLISNIQVLKTSYFMGLSSPLPLGTALFSCVFLSVDLIVEIYGKKSAQQAILLSFLTLLVWNVFTFITLLFTPVAESIPVHQSMQLLFKPGPQLLAASILAYLAAIIVELFIFSALSTFFLGKYLWLRANVSSWVSSAVDGFLFSFLAWKVFAPTPLTLHTIVFTYTLGAWLARIICSIVGIPALYIALHIHNKRREKSISF